MKIPGESLKKLQQPQPEDYSLDHWEGKPDIYASLIWRNMKFAITAMMSYAECEI